MLRDSFLGIPFDKFFSICGNYDSVIYGRALSEDGCISPLSDEEVLKVVRSAWKITLEGDNCLGRHGSWLTAETLDGLVGDLYLATLVAWLQSKNGRGRDLLGRRRLNETFGWSRRKFRRMVSRDRIS